MIELLLIDPNGSTEEREKINEVIALLNRLTLPIRGEIVGESSAVQWTSDLSILGDQPTSVHPTRFSIGAFPPGDQP